MPLPWIKYWLESLDDPKLVRLSLMERGAWWGLIGLAGKCDAGGAIVSGGEALDLDEIAEALHIRNAKERQALESMIEKMKQRASLVWNDGHKLTVVHWEERQRIPPSARPESVRERVRRYRERRKTTSEGDAALPLPEAARGDAALPTSEDDAVLEVWLRVKDFPQGDAAPGFLNQLKAEFPDVDIMEESKLWAASKLSAPLTRGSMPFKQLRSWMMKAREFGQRKARDERKAREARMRVNRGLQFLQKQDRQDPDKYIRGRYGHMVKR